MVSRPVRGYSGSMDTERAARANEPTVDLVAAERGGDPILKFDEDVRNALSVLTGTSRLLEQRWDELPPDRRYLMVEAIARRAEELQASLLPVLVRLTQARNAATATTAAGQPNVATT